MFSENGMFYVIRGVSGLDRRLLNLITGEEATGLGLQPSISGDGRYVVFYAWDGVTPNDVNGRPDVFGYDRLADVTGVFQAPPGFLD